MITAAFEYARPGSIDEAQSLLTKFGSDAKVIAGGQSLIPLMRLRLSQPTALIDIQRISGLNEVRRDNGSVEWDCTDHYICDRNGSKSYTAREPSGWQFSKPDRGTKPGAWRRDVGSCAICRE